MALRILASFAGATADRGATTPGATAGGRPTPTQQETEDQQRHQHAHHNDGDNRRAS